MLLGWFLYLLSVDTAHSTQHTDTVVQREQGLGWVCFLSALLCWLLVAWLFNTRVKDMKRERER